MDEGENWKGRLKEAYKEKTSRRKEEGNRGRGRSKEKRGDGIAGVDTRILVSHTPHWTGREYCALLTQLVRC